jgi:hypothetical protein
MFCGLKVETVTFCSNAPAGPIINSTLFFSYTIGVFASIIAGILYAFGPMAQTDLITDIQPIWHVKFIRFMIPGITIPFFYGIIFAITTAKRKDETFKAIKWGVIAWLILALMLGTLIRASVNLYEYEIKYSGMWPLFGNKRQGDVRFEIFMLIAFLSVLSLIIFENWKIVINTNIGSMFSIRGSSFCSRLISSLVCFVLTGSILALLFWGKSLTPPGDNKVFVAAYSVGLISGWAIVCFYLFTGEHGLIKWIDQNSIAKRAQHWSWSRRIEEARERCKDIRWLSE